MSFKLEILNHQDAVIYSWMKLYKTGKISYIEALENSVIYLASDKELLLEELMKIDSRTPRAIINSKICTKESHVSKYWLLLPISILTIMILGIIMELIK